MTMHVREEQPDWVARLRLLFPSTLLFQSWTDILPDAPRKSSVLVPFFPGKEGPELLFLRRSDRVRQHAGEICFPGGMKEPGDESPLWTALRETEEETAIPFSSVEPLAVLPVEYSVVSRVLVVPVVGIVGGIDLRERLALSPGEIDEAYMTDVENFPMNPKRKIIFIDGIEHSYPEYDLPNGWLVWGVTARILDRVLGIWKGGTS